METYSNEPVSQAAPPAEKVRKKRPSLFYRLMPPVMLIVLLLFVIFNLISPKRTYSSQENRNLAKAPALSVQSLGDGSFFEELSAYQTDQFIGRDFFIRLHYRLARFFGMKENGGVYFGKENYLFVREEEPELQKIASTVEAMDAFAKANASLRMNLVLIPSAAIVHSEKLPGGIQPKTAVPGRQEALLSVKEGLEATSNLTYLNAEDDLKRATEKGQLFYRTDHHWTTFGAYTAFAGVKEAMGIDEPLPSYEALKISDSFQGTLASQSGCFTTRDEMYVFRPIATSALPEVDYYVFYPDEKLKIGTCYRMEKLEEKDQYTVFFGGNYGRLEINTSNFNGKKLLILKDSYANCFIPFLIPYYQQIQIVDPRYYYEDLPVLMQSAGITDVLFLYSESTFFEDASLKDVIAVK